MQVSGFSYVRNGFGYGVPFLESIQSALPLCDEYVIAVGDSTDGTREAILGLGSSKIKIIDTVWDTTQRQSGRLFAQQANIALDAICGKWALHLQADEVLHENSLPLIRQYLQQYEKDGRVDGFLFPFLHFWGDYNHIQNSRRVHRREVRLFKNDGRLIRSYGDSQGFRLYNSADAYESNTAKGQKLRVVEIAAPVYHYNGVKDFSIIKKARNEMAYFYGEDGTYNRFNYHQVPRVARFTGSQPAVMQAKIAQYQFQFEHDTTQAVWRKKKDKYLQKIEDVLGVRIGEFKNYKKIG